MADEMQWTGSNAAEMRSWAGVPFLEPRHGRPAAVSIQFPDGTHGWLPVQVGDIVTRSEPVERFAFFGRDPYPARCKPVFAVRPA